MAKFTPLKLSALLLFASSFFAQAQTVTTFEGIDASQLGQPELDIDPNGAVGTKQYMEWTNVYYQAYDKVTFAPVWPQPQQGTTPWVTNGSSNCTHITGDGVVNFDRLASRWVIAAHNAGSNNYYYCVAISNTDDLSSSSLAWYTYAISLNALLGSNSRGTVYFPDWPKIATWPDAYYIAMDMEDRNNGFQEVGALVCALDRTNMLTGGTARTPQCFHNPSTVTGSLDLGHSLLPADVEGTTAPPTGSPEYFVSIENPVNDGVTTTSDTFNLFQFHVDWANPANSTFTPSTVPVTSYTPGCYIATAIVNTVCVPEPSTATTGQSIDSVGDRFMHRFAYRNFGTYQSYLVSHAVQTGTGSQSQTGIRWYELRGNGVPTVFQSGTISPDPSLYRFMPSIAQDQNGNAAVGYSVSDASTHPGISASWWSLTNQTAPTEISLYTGAGDEENSYHWGDYTSMTVDPVAGCSFWYLNQYFSANQTGTGKPIWQTRISTFTAPGCEPVTLAPSSLTFAQQVVGTVSAKQNVTLTNSQSVALTIHSVYGGGTNPGDFRVSNGCGTSLPAGGFCTIGVAFAPSATGTRTATLNVSDSASNSPQTTTLTGTGIGPVTLSTSSLNFGTVLVDSSSTAAPVTLTNQMSVALTGITFAVTGSEYSQVNTCGTTLAAGGQCTITVTFAPTAAGHQVGTVTITDSASNSPQTIALSGTGQLPVSFVPQTLAFGTVKVGVTSSPKSVTMVNNQKTTLTINSIKLSGGDPGDFTQTATTCGSTLAAGAKCTITFTFTPDAIGARSAKVVVTDSAKTSPQTVKLTGTGN